MIADHFPPMGVRLTTPRLTLRMPTDSDLAELAEAAVAGIHDPATMPFMFPWTDQPPKRLAQGVVQHNWQALGSWTPESWVFNGVVEFEGRVVGIQDMRGRDFATLRQVGTGSWLARSAQGRGIGTEMRAAVLHLAFEGLGALDAITGMFEESLASKGVSRKLGYRPDGIHYVQVRGERVRELRYRLTREDWEEHRTVPVEIEGLEAALPHFGLGDLPD